MTVTGQCLCFTPTCFDGQPCSAGDAACPEGYACVNVACCGMTFCAALCDTPVPAAIQATAPRWG